VSDGQLYAAAAAAVLAGALATLGPRVVALLPEPADPAADKRAYAELGAAPGLGGWLAVTAALAAGAVGLVLGPDAVVATWVYVCAIGIVLAYVDWHTRLLPFVLVAPSYAVVAALVALAALVEHDADMLVRAGAGWLLSFGAFALMWAVHSGGIGYGDVRLSGVLGMALGAVGWQQLVVGLYAAFVFGALAGGLLLLAGRSRSTSFPFGPFMFLGGWFGVVSAPVLASVL
jgi:leader peptidase (prepilin peptidase)/N-methyltransferase